MLKVVLMIGLPGSGKSTIAETIIKNNENIIIISRDAIRTMLYSNYANYKFTTTNESNIKAMAIACMETAFERGYNVIIDETNINKEIREYWMRMASVIGERKNFDVKFMGIWVDTPKDICIARRIANPKETNADWSTIIENMVKSWNDPIKDEFDDFEKMEYVNE